MQMEKKCAGLTDGNGQWNCLEKERSEPREQQPWVAGDVAGQLCYIHTQIHMGR